ncbi:cyclase/dehydrase [Chthoniobacter flavus Ellin428]|uniref:Cyclase/dehydrase n=1 Tax=Chthoniobacter flavus Ellin428 TaxID=497964 RepID=B4CWJ5_9BACT|nr:YgaP-like transmembrane domain [Chthoniobacter flavus]EDY21787.1 cyclase/dehydrase [Chthoniobacter flavus Ellin428]TCO95717.1 putative membrane protein [Chthoniobacter flavus]
MSTSFHPLQKLVGRRFSRLFGMNLGLTERLGSILAGGALIGAGLLRRGTARTLLLGTGAGFLLRGASGHCPLYHQLGINQLDRRNRDGVPGNQGLRIEYAVEVQCPAPELYQFWRNLDQLPRILRHVESVELVDAWHSHWVARGPIGPALEWDAEIINEHENELIAWQSVHGAKLQNAGTVRFDQLSDTSTYVKVCIELQPIGGTAALTLARLFGTDPQRELEEDLERFKDFAERELTPESHSVE